MVEGIFGFEREETATATATTTTTKNDGRMLAENVKPDGKAESGIRNGCSFSRFNYIIRWVDEFQRGMNRTRWMDRFVRGRCPLIGLFS